MGHKGGSDYNTDIERGFVPGREDGAQDRRLYVTRRETKAGRAENEAAEAEKGAGRQMRASRQGDWVITSHISIL